jgi:hypothetical protein
MAFIALAAINFRAMRECVQYQGITTTLSLVAMPMANVLVVSVLIRHRRRISRGFLSGFVVSGAMALAIFLVMSFFAKELLSIYIWYVYKEFFLPQGTLRSLQRTPGAYYLALAVWYTLPQLAFALVGGICVLAFGN